ncbi:unnamed protein product [Ceratitis capitata]|uniref:(Mediterranean fruit fly) hypothetical protein n=1 Tax=Ceratitis capitata TaxID=7213 RepID=A0A811V6A2_CERCA|nr:unnamed protein product [Ceratitis capitata]
MYTRCPRQHNKWLKSNQLKCNTQLLLPISVNDQHLSIDSIKHTPTKGRFLLISLELLGVSLWPCNCGGRQCCWKFVTLPFVCYVIVYFYLDTARVSGLNTILLSLSSFILIGILGEICGPLLIGLFVWDNSIKSMTSSSEVVSAAVRV